MKCKLNGAGKREKDGIAKLLRDAKKHLKVLEHMHNVTDNSGVVFDLLILRANQFNSGFLKEEFSHIPILFPDRNCTNDFGKIVNSMNAEKAEKNEFFYIFYRRKASGKQKDSIDAEALVQGLAEIANSNAK